MQEQLTGRGSAEVGRTQQSQPKIAQLLLTLQLQVVQQDLRLASRTQNRQASEPVVAPARIQVAALDALTAGPSQSARWAVLVHNVGFVPSDDNVHDEGRKKFPFRVSTC